MEGHSLCGNAAIGPEQRLRTTPLWLPNSGMVATLGWSSLARARASLRSRVTSGFIGQGARRKHLQRHIPIKPLIMGAIDDSHAACTNLLDYAVMSQNLPNAGGGN